MWVRCLNPATSALYNEEYMDEKVEFRENGAANVPREVGIALVENYSSIIKYDAGDEDE